jgi:hypothetical protein
MAENARCSWRMRLRVLQPIPGAKYVNGMPKGRTLANLNNMTIGMQFPGGWEALHDSEAPLKDISVHCSAAVPHKLAAALAMIEWLSAVHGRAGLALLRAAPPTQG